MATALVSITPSSPSFACVADCTLQEGLSLAKYIKASPALSRLIRPVANAYARAAGHRQMGLRYDDLVMEERESVQKVGAHLSRLSLSLRKVQCLQP